MIANLLLKNGENAKLYSLWWGRLGSNQRPIGYEPTALTPELRPRRAYYSASEVIREVFQRQFLQLLTKK